MTEPITRAHRALEGLSVGDAFGELFFMDTGLAFEHIGERRIPSGPWRYTDDTEMAISIVEALTRRGEIHQHELAAAFATRMDRRRGYGVGAMRILTQILEGVPWRQAAGEVFRGTGSYGNGGAMRVAPLGAFFADDLERCVAEARASAEVTHMHPEGIAGAIAIACGAAFRCAEGGPLLGDPFLALVAERTPKGLTRDGIEDARRLPEDIDVVAAAKVLGNGSGVSAQDTVPLCLWIASRHKSDYEAALWETVAALGDRDTTCAIVGGMIAAGGAEIPEEWLRLREGLPERVGE